MNFNFSYYKYTLVLICAFSSSFCIAQNNDSGGGFGPKPPLTPPKPPLDFVTTPERLNNMKRTSAEIKADLTQIHALLDKQKQILRNIKTLLENGESRKYCLVNENLIQKITDLKNREQSLSKNEIDSLQSYIKMGDDFQIEIKKSNIKCN